MANKNGTTDRAVENRFPPQEVDPKDIAREVLKIAHVCAEALAEDWHEHGSPRVMAPLCAWRIDTASSGRQA